MHRMLRAVTQRLSAGPERPDLRLRHKPGGKHDVCDNPATANVVEADLVRCRLAVSARDVCAEMSRPANRMAESHV